MSVKILYRQQTYGGYLIPKRYASLTQVSLTRWHNVETLKSEKFLVRKTL